MINLKQFDLDGLSTLWLASVRNPEMRRSIEKELQNHIANNKNFSREFIFKICKILNHALGVFFIPSSEAHTRYGDYVTIDMLLDENELIEMITNYSVQPKINTAGQVRAKVLVPDHLTEEQVNQMATIGFHTRDILKTQHV